MEGGEGVTNRGIGRVEKGVEVTGQEEGMDMSGKRRERERESDRK
jgi:hypothetical protein